ncbi:MAG: chorismate-binding protein [Candidatus Poseidoniaceae archaeon]
MDVIRTVEGLRQMGHLGATAGAFGAPDEVMLLSTGPASHLAKHSMIARPPRCRAVLRQPERLPASEAVSNPLEGEPAWSAAGPLTATVQRWEGGAWHDSQTLSAPDLADLMRGLETAMLSSESFVQQAEGWPLRPFLSGAFAYDLVQWTQPINVQHPPQEGALLAVVWAVDGALLIDHATGVAHRLHTAQDAWAEGVSPAAERPTPRPSERRTKPESSMDDARHAEAIEQVKRSIVEGRMYQVNIGRRWTGPLPDEPWDVMRRLLENNPAPFSAWTWAPDLDHHLLSSSPESLLRIHAGHATTSPIKGTYPRGNDALEEQALRRALAEDEKETAEHRMLVDLMRNDLGAISRPGSVHVQRYDVEAYATVQHLVSHVGSTLTVDPPAAFASVFPGGSITGCPRTVVCAAIDAVEHEPRRFWCGSIGWWDPDGHHGAWNILIRTMQVRHEGEHRVADVLAGGGITIGSVAAREIEEAVWKADALLSAAGWGSPRPSTRGGLRITPLNVPHGAPLGGRLGQRRDRPHGTVVLVDNLDSFTHNIAHAIMQLGHDVHVMQGRGPDGPNDVEEAVKNLLNAGPSHLLLGPGPGRPEEARVSMRLAELALNGETPPLLGVCLGHQALGLAAGGRIMHDPHGPVHGRPVQVVHDGSGLFANVSGRAMRMVRYNSLVVEGVDARLLHVNARSGHVTMGLRSPNFEVHGVQGHPESIGSEEGHRLLRTFLGAAHG